jgi:hypothetical protein
MEASINATRTIGVEVEFVIPIIGHGENYDVQRLIADVLTRQGLPAVCRGYSHQPIPTEAIFAVEHDSSLRDEERFSGVRWAKVELKTAPLSWAELERVMPPALEIVNYLGGRINASCGLHTHHHLPEAVEQPQVVRNLQHAWWRIHQIALNLVAPSRRNNQYCRRPTRDEAVQFDAVRTYDRLCQTLRRLDRYAAVNFVNLLLPERMTVEFRLHQGTLDWPKIRAWALFTQRLVEHAVARSCQFTAEPLKNSRAGLNAMLITVGLKPNSRIYHKVSKDLRDVGRFLLKRWRHFNPSLDERKIEKAVA